jgi:hypothetical protein
VTWLARPHEAARFQISPETRAQSWTGVLRLDDAIPQGNRIGLETAFAVQRLRARSTSPGGSFWRVQCASRQLKAMAGEQAEADYQAS